MNSMRECRGEEVALPWDRFAHPDAEMLRRRDEMLAGVPDCEEE